MRTISRRRAMRARRPRSIWRRCGPPPRRSGCRRTSRRTCVAPRMPAPATPRSTSPTCARSSPRRASIRRRPARGSRSRWTSRSARSGSSCRSRATTISPGCHRSSSTRRLAFPGSRKSRPRPRRFATSCSAVMQDPAAFSPYVTGDANRPRKRPAGHAQQSCLERLLSLEERRTGCRQRRALPEHAARAAQCAAVAVPNRSPSILFSLLKPGAHIPPHNGLVNTRLICHLPLIVPGRAAFASETKFANGSRAAPGCSTTRSSTRPGTTATSTRVILLFDVWRPELSEEERRLVVESVRGDRRLQWHEAGLGHLSIRRALGRFPSESKMSWCRGCGRAAGVRLSGPGCGAGRARSPAGLRRRAGRHATPGVFRPGAGANARGVTPPGMPTAAPAATPAVAAGAAPAAARTGGSSARRFTGGGVRSARRPKQEKPGELVRTRRHRDR